MYITITLLVYHCILTTHIALLPLLATDSVLKSIAYVYLYLYLYYLFIYYLIWESQHKETSHMLTITHHTHVWKNAMPRKGHQRLQNNTDRMPIIPT